jgi:hypothetical protein
MATATRSKPTRRAAAGPGAAVLAAALERTLAEVDADERTGPLLRATRLRLRLELTDPALTLNIAAADGEGNLAWSFEDDPGWSPKLVLRMTAEVANRYLQGRESLPIAIAHGQVSCEGDARTALLYLPAARLLCEPYRTVIEADFPELVAS